MERGPKKQRDLPEGDLFKLARVGHDIEQLDDDMAGVRERIVEADQIIETMESKLPVLPESEQASMRKEIDEWKVLRASMTENIADYRRIYDSAKLLRRQYLDDMLS